MIDICFQTLYEDSFKENWNLPAFSDFGKDNVITYETLARRILRLQYMFHKLGLKKGDKIALAGRNSVQWATVYLSTVLYGATIVPILADFHHEDIQHIVNHSDSEILFVSQQIYDKIDETIFGRCKAILSLQTGEVLWSRKKMIEATIHNAFHSFDNKPAPSPVDVIFNSRIINTDIAAIVYTSGTTGFSKGVMLSYNSLLTNVLFAIHNLHLDRGDKIVSFLPLAHAYGCSFDFLFPCIRGCHIVFLEQIPSPKILMKAFKEVRPRLINSVPLAFEKIYKKQIAPKLERLNGTLIMKMPFMKNLVRSKIRKTLTDAFGGNFIQIVIGGAAINPDVEQFLTAIKFPFTVGYGMTECGPLISYEPFKTTRMQSVGKAINYVEIKIDSDDPHTTVGEIWVKGENVMNGYYKNEDATREVLDDGGWLHTGDLGIMDSEGFVYIRGRSKNMILGASGQNIYPEEIESKLNSLPYIQESLVLENDGSIIAMVYPDFDAVDAERRNKGGFEQWLIERMEENREFVNGQLPPYSTLSRIVLHPEPFEKTPTQKVKRFLYKV